MSKESSDEIVFFQKFKQTDILNRNTKEEKFQRIV